MQACKANYANANKNTLPFQKYVQGVSTIAQASQNKIERWDTTESDKKFNTGANSQPKVLIIMKTVCEKAINI